MRFWFVFSVFPKASSPPQYFWEVHSNAINTGPFTGLSQALSGLSERRCPLQLAPIYPGLILPNTLHGGRSGPPIHRSGGAPLTGSLPAAADEHGGLGSLQTNTEQATEAKRGQNQ